MTCYVIVMFFLHMIGVIGLFFLGYFNIILEHPLALGEVSRLG